MKQQLARLAAVLTLLLALAGCASDHHHHRDRPPAPDTEDQDASGDDLQWQGPGATEDGTSGSRGS